MSIEKSELKMQWIQDLGKRLEDLEKGRNKAVAEQIGGVEAYKRIVNLCDQYCRQFNEEYMTQNKLSIENVQLMKEGVLHIQGLIKNAITQAEHAYQQYTGQVIAIDNIITMLDKDFASEQSRKEALDGYSDPIAQDDVKKIRPVGAAPEKKVGNPRFMENAEEEFEKVAKKTKVKKAKGKKSGSDK